MSYIICFWDKSKLQISDEAAVLLKEAISAETIKTFELGDSLYAVGGVEKIIPKAVAYDVFPTEFQLLQNMIDTTTSFIALESPKLNN